MRYYSIRLTNTATGQIFIPQSLARLQAFDTSYTSFVAGKTLPGALNVEMDIIVSSFGTPAGGSFIKIHGISLQEISQAHDLNGFQVAVYGGMQKGLPLANPLLSGLLFSGFVFQAFGNWIGTEMSLDLILNVDAGTIAKPKNIVHSWAKGTLLKDAIAQTLSTAFPGYTADIEISPDLVFTQDVADTGYYQTIEEYATYIQGMSADLIGGAYSGVRIALTEKVFSVFDGTVNQIPTNILFKDLIGQPTCIGPNLIQFKCPMRADIKLSDIVKMPQGIFATTTQAAESGQVDLKTAFQGSFLVQQVRHVGNFRQPDADSWVTVIDASAQKTG